LKDSSSLVCKPGELVAVDSTHYRRFTFDFRTEHDYVTAD